MYLTAPPQRKVVQTVPLRNRSARHPELRVADVPPDVKGWEALSILILSIVNVIGLALFPADGLDVLNIACPALLAVILGAGALTNILRDPDRIWSPLFWFRVSTGVYFGFGTIVPLITNDATTDAINAFYQAFPSEIAKLDLIVNLGVLTVFSVDIFCNYLMSRATNIRFVPSNVNQEVTTTRLFLLGLAFLIIGQASGWSIALVHTLGRADTVLPGIVNSLTLLSPIGIYMFGLWCFTCRPSLLPLAVLAVVSEVGLGLLLLEKSTPVMAILMFLLAWLRTRPSIFRAAGAVVIALTVYAAITPVVAYARNELEGIYGTQTDITPLESITALLSYTPERAHSSQEGEDFQGSLARVAYSNSATFVINQYDEGFPGDAYNNSFAVFVPRFLWPDKPEMTSMGREVTVLANGSDTSATGIGIFAEGYWCWGWFGTFALLAVGFILSIWTRYSMATIRRQNWFFFPVVLLGMRMGTRVDGDFVPDFLGTAVFAVFLHLIIVILDHLLSELKGNRYYVLPQSITHRSPKSPT